MIEIDRWDDHTDLRDFRSIAPISAHYPYNRCTHLIGVLECHHQIGTDIPFQVAATNREHKDQIIRT